MKPVEFGKLGHLFRKVLQEKDGEPVRGSPGSPSYLSRAQLRVTA